MARGYSVIFLLRSVGVWLLRRFGMPIARDLYAGDRVGAVRRVRRAARFAALAGLIAVMLAVALVSLLLILLIRAVG